MCAGSFPVASFLVLARSGPVLVLPLRLLV